MNQEADRSQKVIQFPEQNVPDTDAEKILVVMEFRGFRSARIVNNLIRKILPHGGFKTNQGVSYIALDKATRNSFYRTSVGRFVKGEWKKLKIEGADKK